MSGPGWKETAQSWLKGGKEVAQDSVEVAKLADDLLALHDAAAFFEENAERFNFDVTDLVRPKNFADSVKEAQTHLENIKRALNAINETDLRFSKKYLGEALAALQEKLQELEGNLAEMIHMSAETAQRAQKQDTLGKLLEPITPQAIEDLRKDYIDLSLELRKAEATIGGIVPRMQGLIDPALETPTNNMFINKAIVGKETYEAYDAFEKGHYYEAFQKAAEALKKAQRLSE